MPDDFVLFRPDVHGAAPPADGGHESGNDGGAAPSFTLFDPTKHKAVQAELPLPVAAPRWTCRYGCTGTLIDGRKLVHDWYCDYWRAEGRHETPFD